MMHTVERETPFGRVKATWERKGRMIEVRYGERMKRAQGSDDDAANSFVAGNILDQWIADDLGGD